jgi:diguanylate cyclase (GGDEF)-like protein
VRGGERTAYLRTVPRLLLGMQVLVTGLYLAGLLWPHPAWADFGNDWLIWILQCVPAVVCWSAVPSAGVRRLEVAVLAAGLSLYGAGCAWFAVVALSSDAAAAFPSTADLGFLAFYPLALIAIALACRRELRAAGATVWLDSLLGGLGAATVMTLVLDRLLLDASNGALHIGLALIYPILDLLVAAAVLGVTAMHGRTIGLRWPLFAAGFLLLTVVDAVSALAFADGSFVPGAALDALWPIGLTLICPWALARPADRARPASKVALAVPAFAITSVLAVLAASARGPVASTTLAFAALTLVVTAARTQLAFRQVRRIADLRRQATTDELTGLANRRAFYQNSGALMAPGTDRALLLLDLDRFKEVNDSLGHHVGDELLRRVADRLEAAIPGGAMLARLGGDEFSVLMSGGRDDAVAAAVRLRAAVAEPVTLEGITLRTDVSIGVSLTPGHGTELRGLLRCADIAMYQAKRSHEGWRVYNSTDDTSGTAKLRVIQELHTALATDQLILHYQPKLDLRTGTVDHVEALVRWEHPTRGLLYPDSFVDLVGEAGLMGEMTDVVLVLALDQVISWRDEGWNMSVAVNLSARSLVDAGLPDRIAQLLSERTLPPQALQLEITEDFLMADHNRAREILTRLRDHGIQISVDDFGTGYSSLAYLRELPVYEMKLDRSFVFPMTEDARAAALVFSTIDLAHSLGLLMVAEGVESQDALTELARHGCDYAQGYFICRPLPAAELNLWLDQREPSAPNQPAREDRAVRAGPVPRARRPQLPSADAPAANVPDTASLESA